jgi:hypothetical protein
LPLEKQYFYSDFGKTFDRSKRRVDLTLITKRAGVKTLAAEAPGLGWGPLYSPGTPVYGEVL